MVEYCRGRGSESVRSIRECGGRIEGGSCPSGSLRSGKGRDIQGHHEQRFFQTASFRSSGRVYRRVRQTHHAE